VSVSGLRLSESKITAPVLGWLEDSVEPFS
jgi:hypothetical protein